MYLSGSQARFATLLLLLLPWENMAFISDCVQGGNCQDSLEALLKRAVDQSKIISQIAMDLYDEFFNIDPSSKLLDEFSHWYLTNSIDFEEIKKSCHTLSLNTPTTDGEAKNISNRDFLRMLMKLVGAWEEPVLHFVMEIEILEGTPPSMLSRAKEVQKKNNELLIDLKKIFLKLHPAGKPKDDFPVWREIQLLHLSNQYTKFLQFYKLTYCLSNDASKTAKYIKYLSCRMTKKIGC